jgi:hypothetical protein
MTGASVRDDTPYNISVTREPLVRLLSIPNPLASASYPPHEESDLDAMGIAAAVDNAEDTHCIEDIPRLYCARTTLADRRARGTEDKTVGQCWGDLGVSVDSPTTFGCRYYRALLLAAASTLSTACVREEPPPQENTSELLAPTASLRGAEAVDSRRPGKTSPDLEETRIFLTHLPPFVAFRAG